MLIDEVFIFNNITFSYESNNINSFSIDLDRFDRGIEIIEELAKTLGLPPERISIDMKCYTNLLKLQEHDFTQLDTITAEMYDQKVATTTYQKISQLFNRAEEKPMIYILPAPINIKSARSAANFS